MMSFGSWAADAEAAAKTSSIALFASAENMLVICRLSSVSAMGPQQPMARLRQLAIRWGQNLAARREASTAGAMGGLQLWVSECKLALWLRDGSGW